MILKTWFAIYVYECILETEEPWKQAQQGNENPAPSPGACGTSANANLGNWCNVAVTKMLYKRTSLAPRPYFQTVWIVVIVHETGLYTRWKGVTRICYLLRRLIWVVIASRSCSQDLQTWGFNLRVNDIPRKPRPLIKMLTVNSGAVTFE